MTTEPVIILGAGMTGLGCAWKLSQHKIPVMVLEKESQIGGLAGTVRQGDYHLDFGPHSFFTEDTFIRQTVLDLFDADPLILAARQVKFYYRGKYLDYPLTPANALFQMGFWESLRCIGSFLWGRLQKKQAAVPAELTTVEEWAIANFGKHLYEVFFKPYTEQFWKMPASELSARSIPTHTRLSFMTTLRHLIQKQVSKTNPSLMDREKLPTFYPRLGYGAIPDSIAAQVVEQGGEILTNAAVTQIDFSDPYTPTVHYRNREGETVSLRASQVISTLPVTHLIKLMSPTPPSEVLRAASALLFRPLLFLGMITEKQNVLPCSYLYTLDRPYNRITEMNKFSPETSPKGDNIIAVEIPCKPGDPLFQASAEALFEPCIQALSQDGFLRREDVKGLMLAKSANAYPVYTKNYYTDLETVLNYLKTFENFKTLGRSGEFRYMDGDQCLRRSFDYVESLLQEVPAPC